MFSNNMFAEISEEFLNHTIKLLCIFHHILNDLTPVHPQAKPVLPNLPNTANLSPLKRRKSDLDKKSLSLKLEKAEQNEKKGIKINYLGIFVQSGHYMKIFETVKASFVNYKVCNVHKILTYGRYIIIYVFRHLWTLHRQKRFWNS